MLQLSILSGKTAGTDWVARRFPVRIGRSPLCDLCLEEDGVWDEHLHVSLDPSAGFIIETAPDALATVNGESLGRLVLMNGDIIEMGSVKLQFFLVKTKQSGLRFREILTWLTIAAVSLAQVFLVYWLIR